MRLQHDVRIMTHADDWFRSGDWDAAAQELFEAKLGRARKTGRAQYLRIKGLGLRQAGKLEAAQSLFLRVLEDYPHQWTEVRQTREHLADMARDARRLDEAVAYYRQVLVTDGHPPLSCTSGGAHLSLAQIHLDRGEHELALEALNYVAPTELGMNALIFRWNALLAEISLALGEMQVSQAAAQRALALLDAPDQFARHPGVGRATADRVEVERLQRLAHGRVPKSPHTGLFQRFGRKRTTPTADQG